MKSILLSTCTLFLIFGSLAAQSFEGVITYKNNYTSKLSQVKDEQFNAMMGSRQDYFIKGGNYKSVLNGSFAQMQLYVQAENRLYSKFATSDTLYWTDGKFNNDEVVTYQIFKEHEEVLGLQCDAIVVETKNSKTTYYFSTKYSVDPSLFKDHKFGNWSFLMQKTGSLPLKIIIENAQFKLVSIATEVKEQNLETNFFQLPEGVPTKVSSF